MMRTVIMAISSEMSKVKKAILIDDILNTGKTFSEASKIVEREGATEIYAVSSHGLFVKGAVELLDQAPIKEILVTDSVAPNGPTPKNINYLTASELIAEAIVRIQERNLLVLYLPTTRNKVLM